MTSGAAGCWRPKLIVSDIDGTFINSAGRVPGELREVIYRILLAGVPFALATGRPFRWLAPVLEQIGAAPVCVTSNGAVTYDPAADRVLRSEALSPEVMAEVVGAARAALAAAGMGTVSVAAERAGVSRDDPERALFAISPEYVHTWETQGPMVAPEEEVLGLPAVKLLLRNPEYSAPELHAVIAPAIDPGRAHVTYSMNEGLLEVAAPGVTKAHGVAGLAKHYGVAPEDVIAFGDMPNDIEMLNWAGVGVAMGNAHPAVKAAAAVVTTTNDEAGVALVLREWF